MTKAFLIAGIIGAFLFISVFMGYAGLSYTGISGFNPTTGETAPLPTNIIDALVDGSSFLFGALIFQVQGVPIWLNLFVWLFTLALVFMIVELVVGV